MKFIPVREIIVDIVVVMLMDIVVILMVLNNKKEITNFRSHSDLVPQIKDQF